MFILNLFDLKGQKAIVTGGGGGLGGGMAEALAEHGAEVLIIDMTERAVEVAKSIADRGFACQALVADLCTRPLIEKAFEQALVLLGGTIDILVNAAGIIRRHKCEDFPIEDWEAVINVNLTTVFSLSQLAGRVMLKNGYGKIVNIASMLSFFGGFTVPSYAASKGGVSQLTKALANEWASRGVHVNAIAPGYMATDMNTRLINDPVRNQEILSRIPAARWGTPEDMKGVVVFLSSHASDYLDGAIIPVDGGYLGR